MAAEHFTRGLLEQLQNLGVSNIKCHVIHLASHSKLSLQEIVPEAASPKSL